MSSCRLAALLSVILACVGAACGAEPEAPPAMERVELADHPPYEGLIESEDADEITLVQIQRRRGEPTHLVIRPIDRRQVVAVVRLDEAGRAKLRREIEQFRNRAAIEAGRREALALQPLAAEGNHYRHYGGKWFSLDSTADEPSTRRVIVRAEQIFAAYRQILPPRTAPPQPPRLVIFGTLVEYQAFLARCHLDIHNSACFLEDKNLVAAGSELARLDAVMAKTSAENERLRREVKQLEGRLPERLRQLAERLRTSGLSAAEVARLVALERRKFDDQRKKMLDDLLRSDRKILQVFNDNTRQTFVRLYHESFHAYLANYVYPPRSYDVPYWLNEGLAVMFEGGVLEGDTLRIDAPNAAALKRLKEDLAGDHPLALEELLAAGRGQFLPKGDAASAAADRYYAHGWGLAYYLAFEKHLLGSPALDRYVA
ncbi:MAG: DUF1570 domain-containing protein, partial [Thermoguttaceae bacterium]